MGSPSHEKIRKIVTEKQLLNDLSQITKQTHNTAWSFPCFKNTILTEKCILRNGETLGGTQLAALYQNNNINRQQVFSKLNANWTEIITYLTKHNYSGPSSSSTLYITTLSPKFLNQFWNEIYGKSLSIRKQVILCIFKKMFWISFICFDKVSITLLMQFFQYWSPTNRWLVIPN